MKSATHFNTYAVIKIAGYDPESFIFALGNSNLENPFMQTSQEMTEQEMRLFLKTRGHTQLQVDALIQKARDNPR